MEQKDRIDQLVAENQELLALTKQAFVKREVEKESVPVDEEWEKFAAEHAEELEALEKDDLQGSSKHHRHPLYGRSGLRRHPSCAKHQHTQTATALYGASDRHEASHLPACRYSKGRHNTR